MTTNSYHFGNWTVTVEQDMIPVYSYLPEPDPDWVHIDTYGHEHSRVGKTYRTLRWVVDRTYWCDECRDEHEDGHWECRLCGEHVQPGTRGPSPFPAYIRGSRNVSLIYDDGQECREYAVTNDADAEALTADPESAAERIAASQEPMARTLIR